MIAHDELRSILGYPNFKKSDCKGRDKESCEKSSCTKDNKNECEDNKPKNC